MTTTKKEEDSLRGWCSLSNKKTALLHNRDFGAWCRFRSVEDVNTLLRGALPKPQTDDYAFNASDLGETFFDSCNRDEK